MRLGCPSAGILNVGGYWILTTGASRPKPGNTPASPRSWCTLSSAASDGSACHATPSASPRSSSPPLPCLLRAAPAETIPRIPDMRRCGTARPAAAFHTTAERSPRCGPPPRNPPSRRRRPPSPPPSRPSSPPAGPHAWLPGRSTSHRRQSPPQLEVPPSCAGCAPAVDLRRRAPFFHPAQSTAGALYPSTRPMALRLLPSVYIAKARSFTSGPGRL